MNKFINEKATKMIEELRTNMKANGVNLTSEAEYFIRMGMSYGLSLASLALANLPGTITLEKEYKDETKVS